MAFPDFIDLLAHWNEFPPVHIALGGIVRPKSSTGNKPSGKAVMNDVEARFLDRGNVLPFKNLPPAVQKWLKETKAHA